jgi:hypothetical protein
MRGRRLVSLASALALLLTLAAWSAGPVMAAGGLMITGNVVGAAGNLGGIVVSGCTDDWSYCTDTVLTDGNGAFSLIGLPAGSYIITIDPTPTYVYGYYTPSGMTLSFQSAVPVSVTSGSVELADIQMQIAYSISGRVTGSAGIAGIGVGACPTNPDLGCYSSTTDADGSYVLGGLAPGSYTMGFSDPNHVYESASVAGSTLTPDSQNAIPFDVTDDVVMATFELVVGATLTGTVTGPVGHLGNIDVSAEGAQDLGYGEALTDDAGNFRITGLVPGNYRIYFQDYTGTYTSGTYVDGGLVQSDDVPFIYLGTDNNVTLNLGLVVASSISGTLSSSIGAPANIDVMACRSDGYCLGGGNGDNGQFSVGGLPAGTYTVLFTDWLGQFVTGYYSDSGTTVPTADQATRIVLPPSAANLSVSLVVTGSGSVPYPPMNVTATPGNGSATVSWDPPYGNGLAITGYTATASDGNFCVTTTTTCVVTGLVNNTSYTFTVTASNAIGTSQASDPSSPVTPIGPVVSGAVRLSITGLARSSVAGSSLSVTVSALDKHGKVVPSYTGTVRVSASDPAASLPSDYTFTAADGGTHIFSVSLDTVGAQVISVGDGTLKGASKPVSVKPGATASLVGNGVPVATAGVAVRYVVKAMDAYGNVSTADTSALSITTSDPAASVSPASHALVHGKRAFSVTFKTAGTQSIQVVDTANPSITASFDGIVVSPGKAVSISLTGLANPVTAGVASTVTATVHDRFGNVATGYVGTVHFTSNDKAALLPSDYTFTAADAGVHTFSVTLKTRGNRWVTIRDASKHSIGGMGRTTVVAQLP